MNFGEALQALRDGKKVKRQDAGQTYILCKNDKQPDHLGIIVMLDLSVRSYDGNYGVQFYSQDLLADDWQIVD